MADGLIAVVGKDFVVMACDCSAARSVMVFKHDEDKIVVADDNKLLGLGGPQCDRAYFGEYVQKNLALNNLRDGKALSVHASAHWIRAQLAGALRSRSPYQVQVLFAGVDGKGPALYWMDYLGSLSKVNYGAHGYCGYFAYSVMDRHYKADMTEDETKQLIRTCLDQLQGRFLLSQPRWKVKTVRAEGVTVEDWDVRQGAAEKAAAAVAGAAEAAAAAAPVQG